MIYNIPHCTVTHAAPGTLFMVPGSNPQDLWLNSSVVRVTRKKLRIFAKLTYVSTMYSRQVDIHTYLCICNDRQTQIKQCDYFADYHLYVDISS